MKNHEVAAALYEIADILEVKGEDPFKIRAYRKGAEAVDQLLEEVADLAKTPHRLLAVPGIGKALAEKIRELVTSGQLDYLEELRRAVPPGVLALTRVPGLGARTAQVLYARLGIDSLDKLELAAREGRLRDLPGMGVKKEAAVLQALERLQQQGERVPLGAVRPIAEALAGYLGRHPQVEKAAVGGSIRRRLDMVADIDLVVASHAPAAVLDYVLKLPIAGDVLERSERTLHLATSLGRRVEVTVVPPARFAAALMQMTGSEAHLQALGELPAEAGSEEAIYRAKGLPYIPPELRENRGELEAARRGALPRLIETSDLKGDLHTHTRASDGTATAREMAEAARQLGHQYIGITDHSQSLAIAGGLKPEQLKLQAQEIRKLNQSFSDFRILHGSEVDILRDGSLDFPDEVLRELDVVVASVHSHMKLDEAAQTERLVQAIKHPHVDIIGHLTGRVLGRRDPYPVDIDRVLEACARTGTALELSASPSRLDLSDLHARLAKHRGVKLSIDTDAHSIPELSGLEHGIDQARRAWVEPADVVGTMDLAPLLAWLAKEKG